MSLTFEFGKDTEMIIKKSKGDITIREISDFIAKNSGHFVNAYAIIIRATEYDGWTNNYTDPISEVKLLSLYDETCPICNDKNEIIRAYEQGVKDGIIQAGGTP